MKQNIKRNFSPYELTQLAKYGLSRDAAQTEPDKPVEYISGKVEFDGLVFSIDQRALIPRVETEELVTKAFEQVNARAKVNSKQPVVIVEVGTGCGAVAIALAKRLKRLNINFQILATDISTEALELARENARQLQCQEQIVFTQQDLLRNTPTAFKQVDVFIANLPYIPSKRIKLLDRNVAAYEPLVALDGGADGFTLIEKFLSQATKYLRPNGTIWLEIDYTH
ncbi:MAG TPA: HemK/PrmC family methyltransferase, partial [Candidatus Woesebacteria bacterium]|nr:HemK/PrmC family methyltransferase [Candidatus Woesebacteria bacterium]